MIRTLAVILLICAPVLAQSDQPQAPRRVTSGGASDDVPATLSVPGTPDRPARPPRRTLGADPAPAPREGSLTNYRIVLDVQHKDQPGQRFSLVMAEGSAELNSVDPSPAQIDAHSVPSTVSLSVTLREVDDSRCALGLVFSRTVPYVAGAVGTPGGQTRSMVQQISVGLNTSLFLSPGQSIIVQDDGKEQIEITLNRVQ